MKPGPFRILLLALAVCGGTLVTTGTMDAQLIQRYTSQQEISTATEIARDSIGQDAILIAIATAGEIDLSPLGFPETIDGFSEEDGTSSIWAYQFATPDAEDEGAVVVVNFNILPQITRVERGNMYGVAPRELIVDAAYSGSDLFAAQLRSNEVFDSYRTEYPDVLADAIVLTWEPDEDLVSIPAGFSTDAPLWAIFYNTDYWEEGDSSLVCFVSSSNGQTYCERSGSSSSVGENRSKARSSISLSANPVARDRSGTFILSVETGDGGSVREFGLYDLSGRSVTDFMTQLPADIPVGASFSIAVSTEEIPAGEYFIRLNDSYGTIAKKVIIW